MNGFSEGRSNVSRRMIHYARALSSSRPGLCRAKRPADAGAVYESFLKTYPEDSEVDKVTLALGRALLDMESREGIRVVKAG